MSSDRFEQKKRKDKTDKIEKKIKQKHTISLKKKAGKDIGFLEG